METARATEAAAPAPERTIMLGYHFTADRLDDGRPLPPVGEWLVTDGPIVLWLSGLHAGEHVADALEYAPGGLLHRVELADDLIQHGRPGVDHYTGWVGRRRRIIATIDATALLRQYARWCASQVAHLWDAPEVVRKYLATGDESLQSAAWTAAWRASFRSPRDEAERPAAQAAERATTWPEPWDVARRTACDAAGAVALAAARDATYPAPWEAVWSAAWAAARTAQRAELARLVDGAVASVIGD